MLVISQSIIKYKLIEVFLLNNLHEKIKWSQINFSSMTLIDIFKKKS